MESKPTESSPVHEERKASEETSRRARTERYEKGQWTVRIGSSFEHAPASYEMDDQNDTNFSTTHVSAFKTLNYEERVTVHTRPREKNEKEYLLRTPESRRKSRKAKGKSPPTNPSLAMQPKAQAKAAACSILSSAVGNMLYDVCS